LNSFACAFRVLGCSVAVQCDERESFELLRECYSAFLVEPGFDVESVLDCRVSRSNHNNVRELQIDGESIQCPGDADLLYDFEKAMTMWLQRVRSELFFAHAAVLSTEDRCVVIPGASGDGKSNLAWSLCHSGFRYLSDELAPIDPGTLTVEPYPHALCLKSKPLSGPSLPKSTVRTDVTMHVPAYELPNYELERSCSIGAMVFIDSCRNGLSLKIESISSAAAAARLYSNGLNQLAHLGDGLPAATNIAKMVPSYFVTGGTVAERTLAIKELL